MRQRPGTGPIPPGVRPGTGPMRQRPGPAEYQPERYSSGYGGPSGHGRSDSWGGDYDDSAGASFVPGLGGPDDLRRPDDPFTGQNDAYGDFEGAAWQGDDYDDGYDAPRDRRGRNAGNAGGGDRNIRGNSRARTGYDDYDDYDSRDNAPVPKRKRGPIRRLAPWIAIVVVLLVIGVPGYYAYTLYMNKYHPADYSGSGTTPAVTVEIKQGDTASSLAPELAQLGVVKSSRAFVLAAEHSATTAGLEPGTYKLNQHMQASLAYTALLNPKNRVQLTFTVPEGKRAAQIIATLAKDMNVPVATFQNILNNPGQLGLPSYAKGKAEGYLWPATYAIQPKTKPLQVMQAMVAKFNQESQQQGLPAAANKRRVTMEQLMIEASLVQAEAGTAADMPKIARVIINRFNANMPLQFDSVLEYGLNKFAVNIQDSWASIPGPYNDFQNKGLPPTPIDNPGLDAINAVLHPAQGNWLYFLAYPNGKSIFSATPLKGMS
jgi:peptidoglycan lytic transglycosylase G